MSEQPAVKVLMLKGEKGNTGNGISEGEMAQINSKIDSSVASAEKSIEEGLEHRLAEMKFVPVVFANVDEIKSKYPNGADGLFIAGDTGHLWVFVSGNWKDCGQYQTAGLSSEVMEKINNSVKGVGFNIASTSDLVAPYDSLDTLPLNSIVTYGIGVKGTVRNAPSNFAENLGATVITCSTKISGGAVQILVSQSHESYYRICWGYPGTWNEWTQNFSFKELESLGVEEPHYFLQSEIDSGNKYTDLDNLISNQVITYAAGDMSKIKNAPSDVAGTLIVSSASGAVDDQIKAGQVQIFITSDNEIYQRIRWGYPATWGAWVKNFSFHYFLQSEIDSGNKYTDLDNLISNQVITYATGDMPKIKNAPSDVAGTLIVSSASGAVDDQIKAGQVQIFVTFNNEIYQRIRWGYPATWGAWKSVGNYEPAPSLAMFQRIGIVGDSYASGVLVFDGNYADTEHYEISWGQVLARKNGATAVNFSVGGLTTRSWLTNEHGLPLLNSSEQQDLYICALGINDRERLGESYIGSESDIDSGADTFYGNYGKIIKAIQSKSPNSKIVISTLASSDELSQKFNSAIETISKHFGIALIKQSDDPFFTSTYYLDHMHWGHPTGPVYAEMANAIERLISQQMVENISYFETYKK